MYCTKCGVDLPEDSQFCRKCGKPQAVSSTSAGEAVAVAPAAVQPPAVQNANTKKSSAVWRLIFTLLVVGGAWYYLRVNLGEKATREVIATVTHTPVTLADEVENLPDNSWKGVALNLPYTGTATISVNVLRGNPLDVFLTPRDQVDAMNRADWSDVKVYTDFSASKTMTYKRDSRLSQGSYYLVLRDTSLGILSARASDVSVKVQVSP
jgi:hypothetical protein